MRVDLEPEQGTRRVPTGQPVYLEHKEWTQVISAIAAVHPLIAKISSQLAQQQEQARAEEQIQREREHPPAASRGISTPSGNSYRAERGSESER